MLPFDYTSPSSNIAIGTAVVYSFLFIYFWWVCVVNHVSNKEALLYIIGSVSGIINASLVLASIDEKGTKYGYQLALAGFVFYFMVVCSAWLIGIREAYRVIRHHSKNTKHQFICRQLVNVSYWVAAAIIGFACAVEAVHYSWIPRNFSGETITNDVLGYHFFLTIMALRWLLVIIYFTVTGHAFSLSNRKNKDVLVLFGVSNTVATIVDTVYMATSFSFFSSLIAGFVLFFFTDVLIVIPLLITALTWRPDTYKKLLSDQTV